MAQRLLRKILVFFCWLYLAFFSEYSFKFVIATEESQYLVTNLDTQIVVRPDGFIEFSEVVSVDFLNNESVDILKSIPLRVPDKEMTEHELDIRDIRVTNIDGESLSFTKNKTEEYLNLKINISDTNKNKLPLKIDYIVGGGIYYFAQQDGLNTYFSTDNFNSEIQKAKILLTLPQDLQEKDISFSCFDQNKKTENCRARISGYRINFDLPKIKEEDLYTIAVRFPIGTVDVTNPIKKKTFIEENIKDIVVIFTTALIFSGIFFLMHKELTIQKKTQRKKSNT